MTADLDFFGPEARFHHIGLAVRSIAPLRPEARPTADPIQRVSVAFVDLHGLNIELIEPLGASSPIERSLRNGTKLVHLCYEVGNLALAVNRSRTYGFRQLSLPVPAQAFEGRRISWVYSPEYGLFELLERPAVQSESQR